MAIESVLEWEKSYLVNYVAETNDPAVVASLRHHFDASISFLRNIPAARADYAYADGKWTLRQVIGHVADAQVIFAYRALCMARGESKSLPGFDENLYALRWRDADVTLSELIEVYTVQAKAALAQTVLLRPADWDRKGVANGIQVTPSVIYRALMGHERHHFRILRERYGIDNVTQ